MCVSLDLSFKYMSFYLVSSFYNCFPVIERLKMMPIACFINKKCLVFNVKSMAISILELATIFFLWLKQCRYCHKYPRRHIIVSKGSNCLFDDLGFDGCVI